MSAKEKIIEAIREFNWGRYSQDQIEMGLADYPDAQDWVEALADAVCAAIDDQPFHTIDLREDGWTLKHPLDCRDDLFGCVFNDAARALDGPPDGLGIYRVVVQNGDLVLVGDALERPSKP